MNMTCYVKNSNLLQTLLNHLLVLDLPVAAQLIAFFSLAIGRRSGEMYDVAGGRVATTHLLRSYLFAQVLFLFLFLTAP